MIAGSRFRQPRYSPMRRHPALRDLSSEHHSGLVLARRARKAAGTDGSARSAAWEEVR
jgi:hypothetical protein